MSFARTSSPSKRTSRRFFLESLEQRELMAADLLSPVSKSLEQRELMAADLLSPVVGELVSAAPAAFFSSAADADSHLEGAHLEILRDFPTQAPADTAVTDAVVSGLSAALLPL